MRMLFGRNEKDGMKTKVGTKKVAGNRHTGLGLMHAAGVDLCHVGEDGHDRHRTELAGVAEDGQRLQS